ATSRALLGQNETVVNGLVSPTGTPGMVKISTGPLSSGAADGIVPLETAIGLPAARCSGRTRRWSTAWSLPPVRREWLRSPPAR
ncbi:oxo-acid lyase, partial [Providencia rettgeri]|nr:oxo-acid lyase [Providencia rettgeri]